MKRCPADGKCGHDSKLNREEVFGHSSPESQIQEKGLPCARKCNCYLTQTMIDLKRKLTVQAGTLKKLEHNQIYIKCNVTLTKSEEELFCGSVKSDSTVCSVLIRELRTQKKDLNNILNCWTEFANTVEELALTEVDIQNKLSDLEATLSHIIQRTKNFEQFELTEENCIQREQKQFLQRSEERRTYLKDVVNSYLESEDRDHLIREDRRMREKALDKERLMDRAALKLALKRMMRIMGAPEIAEIQKTSSLLKKGKSASRINMPRAKDSSEFTLYRRRISTCGNFTLKKVEKMSASSFKAGSSERLATISRHCRETERSKGKEDGNLKVEKKMQPFNGCECNSRFSSNVPQDSISVQIQDARDTELRKSSWWLRSKNKIRKNNTVLCGKKTSSDACGSAISK